MGKVSYSTKIIISYLNSLWPLVSKTHLVIFFIIELTKGATKKSILSAAEGKNEFRKIELSGEFLITIFNAFDLFFW